MAVVNLPRDNFHGRLKVTTVGQDITDAMGADTLDFTVGQRLLTSIAHAAFASDTTHWLISGDVFVSYDST